MALDKSRGDTVARVRIEDRVITAMVESALLADPEVRSLVITVKTRKGKVKLNGYVDDLSQIDRMFSVTRGVPGVKGIKITIKPSVAVRLASRKIRHRSAKRKTKTMAHAVASAKRVDTAVVIRNDIVQHHGRIAAESRIDNAVELPLALAVHEISPVQRASENK